MKQIPVMIAVTNDGNSYEVLTITGDWSGVYLTINDKCSILQQRIDFWEIQLIAYLKGTR